MQISKIIADRRKELNLTLEEVGNMVGVSKSTVKKWEDGFISNMRRDKISLLAAALRLNPVSLITGEYECESPDNILPMPKLRKLPRLGTIACGEPILAEENIEDYDSVPENIRADFTLKCKGDSMINARILDGDIVYIRQQPDVESGEIAAVLIGNEATLKRVYKYTNKIVLQPENPKYEPLVFVGEELNQIRIIGKAVSFTSMIK